MTTTTLADEVMLHVAASTGGRTASWRVELGIALAGAVLIDLAAADRVVIRGPLLLINRPGPQADPVQNEVLHRLAARRRAGSLQEWIHRLAPLVRQGVETHLRARGLLIPTPARRTPRLLPRHRPSSPEPPNSPLLRLLHATHRSWATPAPTPPADEPSAVTAVCAAVTSCADAAQRQLIQGY
ncbi:GPP34 family phosphoprotein [Streptomyces cyaneofuscatus]